MYAGFLWIMYRARRGRKTGETRREAKREGEMRERKEGEGSKREGERETDRQRSKLTLYHRVCRG